MVNWLILNWDIDDFSEHADWQHAHETNILVDKYGLPNIYQNICIFIFIRFLGVINEII